MSRTPPALLIEEAARIMCEQGLVDFRSAKEKAAARLGCRPDVAMPSNAELRDAVLGYQQLFGGQAYREQLRAMRETALRTMKLLHDYRPRLVGAAVDGAVHHGHRVQIHAFSDAPEMLDFTLEDRAIAFAPGERRYRVGKRGQNAVYPMLSFEAGDVGVDITVFPENGIRQPPLSPVDGAPMKRLDAAAVERLLQQAG